MTDPSLPRPHLSLVTNTPRSRWRTFTDRFRQPPWEAPAIPTPRPRIAQITVIRTHEPDTSDQYTELIRLNGVSLAPDPNMPLFIDDQEWTVVGKRATIITTDENCIVTVILVVPGDRT